MQETAFLEFSAACGGDPNSSHPQPSLLLLLGMCKLPMMEISTRYHNWLGCLTQRARFEKETGRLKITFVLPKHTPPQLVEHAV
jgi:hypothetical protein